MRILHPSSPEQAQQWQVASDPPAMFVGAATAMQLGWSSDDRASRVLIDVSRLPALQGITLLEGAHAHPVDPVTRANPAIVDPHVLRIGAACSLEQVRHDARVREHAPLLAKACDTVGSMALRHRATLGGNLGWRQGDCVPALFALDAQAELADGSLINLGELLDQARLPLVVALRLPVDATSTSRWGFVEKIGWRAAFSPSRLVVALTAERHDGRYRAVRAAMSAAGLPARGLPGLQQVLQQVLQDDPVVSTRERIEVACRLDLPAHPALARLLARVVAGQLGVSDCLRGARQTGVFSRPAMAHATSSTDAPLSVLTHQELLRAAQPRPDSAAKLAGDPGFLSDRLGPGHLQGAILGSPHPHARILAIDTEAARKMPGVQAVLTAADIPGVTHYGLRVVDRPVLCAEKVRCVGDPVAAVAADTLAQAQAAVQRIVVHYELLPVVDDPHQALQPAGEPVHVAGNLLHQSGHARGDLARAFGACTVVIDDHYQTGHQMPAYLETEAGVAEPDGQGGLILSFGCQNPARDQQVIAAMLGLAPDRVRAIGSPVGGSYGGKDELTIQPIAALLAYRTGRAVRLRLDRPASVDLGVKRHPMRIRMRSGCDAQGRLLAHEVEILADTGAYATHGPEVLDAAIEHSIGPYRFEAVSVRGQVVYTNNGIAGAMRGFGAVQVQFALEQQIQRLADMTGIDPLRFRQINLVAPDGPGPLGQVVAAFDGPQRVLQALQAVAPHWHQGQPASGAPVGQPGQPASGARWHRATGLALIHRSDGYGRGGPNASRLALALAGDGQLEVRASFTEMGQNLLDTMRELAAGAMRCAAQDVRAVIGDSSLTPDSGAVAASRATSLVHRALQSGGGPFVTALCERAGRRLGCAASSLRLGPGGFYPAGASACLPAERRLSLAELARDLAPADLPVQIVDLPADETPSEIPGAHHVFGACAALAQVALDTWSGAIRLERLLVASALGPVVSAQGYLGQIEGGALMGAGMVLTEDLPMVQGRYQSRNLDGYLMPTLADAPVCEVIAVTNTWPGDTVGPRGAGEIGVNIGATAVANAISKVIGHPVRRLPVRPDDMLDLLEQAS